MIDCKHCAGTGKVIDSKEDSGEKDCSRCKGVGKIVPMVEEGPAPGSAGGTGQ